MITKNTFLTVAIIAGIVLLAQKLMVADGIDVKQAQSMSKQGALLLDVREPEEYAEIHVPNATLIPLGTLGSRLQEIETYKHKPIVVMCRSGHRSSQAVSQLKQAGYTQVSNVKGGITAWEKEGLEVVRR